jgi:hypothetical protein
MHGDSRWLRARVADQNAPRLWVARVLQLEHRDAHTQHLAVLGAAHRVPIDISALGGRRVARRCVTPVLHGYPGLVHIVPTGGALEV